MKDKDRERLCKLLGMTGSIHNGEALSAARMANELVRRLGLTWFDVIGPGTTDKKPKATKATRRPKAKKQEPPAHAAVAREALEDCPDGVLTDWEISFLEGLSKFNTLSDKQRAVFERLVAKVVEAMEVDH